MLVKKIINYGRDNGIKALTLKLKERVKYKKEANAYIYNRFKGKVSKPQNQEQLV